MTKILTEDNLRDVTGSGSDIECRPGCFGSLTFGFLRSQIVFKSVVIGELLNEWLTHKTKIKYNP